MNVVLAIAATNLRRMLRDRSSLFFVFVFPLALILLIGATFGGGASAELAIWTDGGPLADEVVAAIDEVQDVDVSPLPDRDDVLDAVNAGRATAGVVVHADEGRIEYLARPGTAGPVLQSVVEAAVARVSTRAAAIALVGEERTDLVDRVMAVVPPVTVSDQRIASDESGLRSLGRFDLGAAQQLFLFVFVTSLSGAAALILSRQLGVTRRMLAAPVSSVQVLAGEGLGRFVVALVQALYIVLGTAVLFDVDWGDPIVISVVVLLFCAISAGAAMLIGATLRNDQQAGSVGVMAGLGIAALGGSMVPMEAMSPTMVRVAHLTPHAWALDAVAESVRWEGTLADAGLELAVLAGAAVALLSVASWALHRVTVRSAG